jgi:MFS superfamily sulfate permease-like transporter
MILKYWKNDLRASIVVFLVALPLCLGIALASGAPLISGLIAGIVGGIVVGLLSNSPISVSGPAAGLTVIVSSAIAQLGDFQTFTLAVFVAGLIQILFGLIKGGRIGNYFPTSVIKGMLAAIGLILILKQFPHAIGYDADYFGDESFFQYDGKNTFSEILWALRAFHPGSVIIALLSFAIMISWSKASDRGKAFFQLIPGALVAVVSSVLVNELFKSFFTELIITEKHLVQLPFSGGLESFLQALSGPNWSQLMNVKVYTIALTIAAVASIETLLSIDAADKIDEEGRITSKNRELLAQGIGNSISGLLGGLPVTAVIVRTSANTTAGAKSNLSAVLHGVWLLLCIITISGILNMIPLSSLAAMLILVGYKLTNLGLIKKMYSKGVNQFAPFLFTIIAILFTDLLTGIFIGMIVGFVFVLKSNLHKSVVMVMEEKNYLIRFYKDVSFLQKTILLEMFDRIPANASVVIDGSKGVFVDDDISDLIEDFVKRAKTNGIKVELKKSNIALSSLFKADSNG